MAGSRDGGTVKRVAAELVIVFAGVLIALAVDSWWAAREDHASLRSNLESLARDMDQAAAALEDAIQTDSANAAFFREVHDGLLTGDSLRYDRLTDPPEATIRIAPVPLGTLRFLVTGGGVRLIESGDVRSTLIQGLSTIELYQGWNNDLAAEGRRAIEQIDRAKDESAATGGRWPASGVRNPNVIGALTVLAKRLENITVLQQRILGLVQQIGSAARDGAATS